MNRRDSVAAVMAMGIAPHLAHAQPAGKVFLVGFLAGVRRPPQGLGPVAAGMVDGLRALGYSEGQHFHIEARFAEGQIERLSELAAELVRLNVDVIVASTNLAAFPAKQATSTIPIVVIASHGADETGLITSLARPGGNVTGIESLAPELDVKRLELLRETMPKAKTVAVLSNPQDLGTALHHRWSQGAAEILKLKLNPVSVSRASEFETAFAAISAQGAEAILVFTDSVMFGGMAQMTAFSQKSRIPLFAEFRQFTDAGGLLSYGPNLVRMARDGARHIDRIFKGAKPADLPVERPTEFELVINLKTASAMGITIPKAVLLRADEVIR